MTRILKASIDSISSATKAELVLQGKRESFFRDLFSRACTLASPETLCKPEWDIPPGAARRWGSTETGRGKTKGIIDLAVLPADELLAEQPLSLVEFKLWYTLDAVSPSRFSPAARVHHSIPKSAVTDREKIRAARGGRPGDDYLVTYLLTAHVDRSVEGSNGVSRASLESIGVAYASAHSARALVHEGFDSVRRRGLDAVAQVLAEDCGETEIVSLGDGLSRGVPVSIDCLVTRVH